MTSEWSRGDWEGRPMDTPIAPGRSSRGMTRTVREDAPMDMDTSNPSALHDQDTAVRFWRWQRAAGQKDNRGIRANFDSSALANADGENIVLPFAAGAAAASRLWETGALNGPPGAKRGEFQNELMAAPLRDLLGHGFAIATLSCRPTPVGELLRRCSIVRRSLCYARNLSLLRWGQTGGPLSRGRRRDASTE
jgi:hypothetical protein